MISADFIASSHASKEAARLANLLKNLNLSAIITGEKGVGKTTLAKSIVNADIVNGEDFTALLGAISTNSVLIIKNFHKIQNFEILREYLKSNPTRVIATADNSVDEKIVDTFFGIKIAIPSLLERPNDAEALAKKFYVEAGELFFGKNVNSGQIDLSGINIDLSGNAHSLRRSIYTAFLAEQFKEEDILDLLKKFLLQKIKGGDSYKKLLYIFEVPLFRAGFEQFHSQLAISKNFDLNRNTVRKKLLELRGFFKADLN